MDAIGTSAGRGGLFARALRGSAVAAAGYGGSQAIRLASNLILTRLLFPEAFGLMALVSVFLVGLAMFSDIGLGPSIQQNRRGDEPSFLNTAWTIQVIRGALLWLGTCAVAWPVAQLYATPDLARLLPVAGLSLLIAGFNPTRIETANRHLLLGRFTLLDLCSQVIAAVAMVVLSWATGSVWALVWGAIAGALSKLVVMHVFLPGPRNRFAWDREAASDLIHFGKWIFLSTACGFLLSQGDKAILGRYLSLEALGFYNIGFFLASFPMLLGMAVVGKVMIPVYRDSADGAAPVRRRLARLRLGLSLGLMSMLIVLALMGVPLVGLMYDPRYAAAGAVVVAVACLQMPMVIGMSYDSSALAAGDARGFFLLSAAKATVQTLSFLAGAEMAGLAGAMIGQGLAWLVIHPMIVMLARRHRVWDPVHDLSMAALAVAGIATAIWLNQPALSLLWAFGRG